MPEYRLASSIALSALVLKYTFSSLSELKIRGIANSARDIYRFSVRKFFKLLMTYVPNIKKQVNEELETALQKLEVDMVDQGRELISHVELPNVGLSETEVKKELEIMANMHHSAWEEGKVSGAVYHGGEELLRLQAEAYGMFSVSNQLHPDVFPGVRKMESEIVSMVLKMFNGPETGCGTTTSGGTESLLMACLSAKMKAYHERGVVHPEIIAPVTIHAGFDKAAYYFDMTLRHAPVDPVTFQVDLGAVKRLVNSNTVLIAGSAPNFPHGIIDDIEGLSRISLRYKIPLHVDACLGSFVVPFLQRAYAEIDPSVVVPLFDFRVLGVTSISCDTHKYGFAPKGSSVIMYRSPELRRYQYFLATDWSGGIYASPTLAGSRPGALMAGCWASLVRIGVQGYLDSCKNIVSAAKHIKEQIETIDGLVVVGNPISSVVAFTSTTLNVYDISDKLTAKGWHLSALQNPAAIHIACTRLTVAAAENLITDLRESVEAVAESGSSRADQGDTAMLYGVAGSISTNGLVDELAVGFLDNLYKV
ncbi:pyridoxal phosphate-dependent transferase [Lipomyces arxii]|uniref:pyridoxal phosphate-dependent transferase n=1 Tax=Lipomyces arxii TaxID=56418 RepID=UPI0034CFF63D